MLLLAQENEKMELYFKKRGEIGCGWAELLAMAISFWHLAVPPRERCAACTACPEVNPNEKEKKKRKTKKYTLPGGCGERRRSYLGKKRVEGRTMKLG